MTSPEADWVDVKNLSAEIITNLPWLIKKSDDQNGRLTHPVYKAMQKILLEAALKGHPRTLELVQYELNAVTTVVGGIVALAQDRTPIDPAPVLGAFHLLQNTNPKR